MLVGHAKRKVTAGFSNADGVEYPLKIRFLAFVEGHTTEKLRSLFTCLSKAS